MIHAARKKCADVLYSVYKNQAYLSEELKKVRKTGDFSSADMRFINEITTGVLKNKLRIDYVISCFSSIKLKKISDYILCILEIGVYQIMLMDKVPTSAAVNECVNLTKAKGLRRSSGFVNAVLRKVSQSAGVIEYPFDKAEYISVYYSVPRHFVDRWIADYGVDFTENLCASFLERAPLLLRCNLNRCTVDELVQSLRDSGAQAHVYKNSISPIDCFVSCGGLTSLTQLDAYKKGYFYVQDYAAGLTVEALGPKEGQTVVDACAAPGGKTTHMAEKMKNRGKIYAFDIHEHKLDLIRENAARLGADIIETRCADSSQPDESLTDTADAVLVDAPCSGLGILRRKPDIKYFRTESDIESLARTGYGILENSSRYVKKGGFIVYSTCTIDGRENGAVTQKFLENHRNFVKVPIDCVNVENDGDITLFPNVHGCDGFYICKMQRID